MFEGVITALVTPFRGDLLDEEALRRLVDEQIAARRRRAGSGRHDGRVAHADQRGAHPRHRGGGRGGRRSASRSSPGTGSNSTHEAIEMSVARASAPAPTACCWSRRTTTGPGQEHLYRHFQAVMQAAPLPTVLYNVPARTASRPAARDDRAPRRDARAGRRQGGDRLGAARVADHRARRRPARRAVGRRRDGVPAVRAGRRAASSPSSATSRPR